MTADQQVADLTTAPDRVFEWHLAKWEKAPPAPESFDPRAALLRVLAIVQRVEAEPSNYTDELWCHAIRAAIQGGRS